MGLNLQRIEQPSFTSVLTAFSGGTLHELLSKAAGQHLSLVYFPASCPIHRLCKETGAERNNGLHRRGPALPEGGQPIVLIVQRILTGIHLSKSSSLSLGADALECWKRQ